MTHDTPDQTDIVISETDFEQFRDFFYRKTGILFGDNKRYFVDRRIIQRMNATKNKTFRSYLSFLKFEAAQTEFGRLVDLMTVNETYFFREALQFDCLVRDVLAECLARRGGRGPLRIWSMPCSTGEEVYSIALYLMERWPPIKDIDVELVGSDISEAAIEAARSGEYNVRSIQNLPMPILERYFTRTRDGNHLISQDIRNAVDFRTCNICDENTPFLLKNFDVVFCRNMLIYFDYLSQKKAAENIFSSMRPGAFLFLGHSESMSRISSIYTVRSFVDCLAYQRPLS